MLQLLFPIRDDIRLYLRMLVVGKSGMSFRHPDPNSRL